MKFLKGFLILFVCMTSLTSFSFTSEPKQKSETTIVKDFVQTQDFTIVENVKEYTFNDVFKKFNYNFVSKESSKTTDKYIFDVGWQSKENYNYTNKKQVAVNSFKYDNFRIRNDC